MKSHCIGLALFATVALILGAGCSRKPKITELQRKEAAHVSSEADFALTLRDWARAEGLLTKAAQLCPDNGPYWVNLGAVRVQLGNKAGAKAAYESALRAYQAEADEEKMSPEPWLRQVYVLALLGRADEARKTLDKAAKKFPDNRNVKAFIEGKQLDRMMADPKFKQAAI